MFGLFIFNSSVVQTSLVGRVVIYGNGAEVICDRFVNLVVRASADRMLACSTIAREVDMSRVLSGTT